MEAKTEAGVNDMRVGGQGDLEIKGTEEEKVPSETSLESPKVDKSSVLAKMKRRWKRTKDIKSDTKNDMIKQMAAPTYKMVGTYTRIKIVRMLELLNSTSIDLDRVRVLCFNGVIEDCRGLRSTVWKLILYHLPLDATQWLGHMQNRLEEYNKLKADYMLGLVPSELMYDKESAALWEDVEKDIKRTRPDVSFFTEPVDKTVAVNSETHYDVALTRKADLTPEQRKNYILTHGDVIGRLLYIYGRRHPNVLYVQGMNELLAVIYYLFAKDCIPSYEQYVESDAFYCFENLMAELQDWFISTKDREPTGIRRKLEQLAHLIERNRKDLWEVIQKENVDINIFAIRWQMLLLCQDFQMPDVTRLWDTLLSDMARFNFFSYICLALIVHVEEEVLNGEFDTIVKSINDSPSRIEVRDLIVLAKKLLALDVEHNFST